MWGCHSIRAQSAKRPQGSDGGDTWELHCMPATLSGLNSSSCCCMQCWSAASGMHSVSAAVAAAVAGLHGHITSYWVISMHGWYHGALPACCVFAPACPPLLEILGQPGRKLAYNAPLSSICRQQARGLSHEAMDTSALLPPRGWCCTALLI